MAVATAGQAGTEAQATGPGSTRSFTWDDLQQMPGDSLRRELVDGQLLVTPAPVGLHQRAVGRLHLLLAPSCPDDLEVLLSPSDWKLSATTVFVPDLMVIRRDQFNPTGAFTGTPLLVVEIRSPSTAATDRTLKRQQYERYGAGGYWLVDPGGPAGGSGAGRSGGGGGAGAGPPTAGGRVPSLTALRLVDGAYAEEVTVRGDEPYRADFPFPVTVVPDHLVQ